MATIKGGDKFQAAMAELASKIDKPATLRVGFLEGATYPDGTPVAMVAAIQEYGAPKAGIPPRPFFRNMIEKHEKEWAPAIAGLLKSTDMDAEKTLNLAGSAIEGQLKQSIIETNTPPLSQVTLMIRKMIGEGETITKKSLAIAKARLAAGESTGGVSTKPLIWTRHMLKSTGFEVKT